MKKAYLLAIAHWRKQPARARKDAVHYFRDEAAQSDSWARHEEEMGRALGEECRRHREDAAAMRAALAVLKAAERRGVSSKKRGAPADRARARDKKAIDAARLRFLSKESNRSVIRKLAKR